MPSLEKDTDNSRISRD